MAQPLSDWKDGRLRRLTTNARLAVTFIIFFAAITLVAKGNTFRVNGAAETDIAGGTHRRGHETNGRSSNGGGVLGSREHAPLGKSSMPLRLACVLASTTGPPGEWNETRTRLPDGIGTVDDVVGAATPLGHLHVRNNSPSRIDLQTAYSTVLNSATQFLTTTLAYFFPLEIDGEIQSISLVFSERDMTVPARDRNLSHGVQPGTGDAPPAPEPESPLAAGVPAAIRGRRGPIFISTKATGELGLREQEAASSRLRMGPLTLLQYEGPVNLALGEVVVLTANMGRLPMENITPDPPAAAVIVDGGIWAVADRMRDRFGGWMSVISGSGKCAKDLSFTTGCSPGAAQASFAVGASGASAAIAGAGTQGMAAVCTRIVELVISIGKGWAMIGALTKVTTLGVAAHRP
ncbi:hypothetical protein BDK51DRAFT_38186 [Blyttiomyces helicus]|uniref:Uncharacterized protein n=1 Tax=Blyttiomyces helicus TaxID=388810 RepID=A0A4P9WB20_9FUNG|nr:hypothetical protein BDK51DRAFT_38186 [Blyttiomyces helicus]|eukprot:RKO88733.1 hypothetical protein BDK51DRAFT_38186 [Blyttiomyces helicus]